MRTRAAILLAVLAMAGAPLLVAQEGSLTLPKTVEAGKAFSIQSSGSGKATLYIVGLGQVLKRDVQLGEAVSFPTGSIYSAGHYVTVLARESAPAESASFDVVPASQPSDLI